MTIKFRVHKVAADRDITKIKDLAEKAGLALMTVSGLWNNSTLGWLTDKSRRGSFPHVAGCAITYLSVTSRQVQDGKYPSFI